MQIAVGQLRHHRVGAQLGVEVQIPLRVHIAPVHGPQGPLAGHFHPAGGVFGKTLLPLSPGDLLEDVVEADAPALDKVGIHQRPLLRLDGLPLDVAADQDADQKAELRLTQFSVHPECRVVHHGVALPSHLPGADFQEVRHGLHGLLQVGGGDIDLGDALRDGLLRFFGGRSGHGLEQDAQERCEVKPDRLLPHALQPLGRGEALAAEAPLYRVLLRRCNPLPDAADSLIPATLIESELFGYEKGAFSGANSAGKKGLFEAANEGTILLDEIGDMPLEAQAKLLRVLQNSEVTRVGGTKPIKLNIRVIASTNNNLKEKIKAGTFRQDLYYRLHIIPIHIPPLRERRDDIPLLCQHYLDVFANQYHRAVTLSEENMALLRDYAWPGNIRELRNIMEYLVVCCADIPCIDNSLLRGILDLEEPASAAPETEGAETAENLTLGEAVARCERGMLKSTMRKVSSMKAASQLLGVDISTISRKLKQYGLSAKGEEL